MSMKENSLSVIITTYNRAYVLDRAIKSVLAQTYKNFELIVVDDHSTDETKELVKTFSQKDKRVNYIKNKGKQGPSAARNFGLENSKGNYIAFLESDDEWVKEHLERSIQFLSKYDADLVFSDINKLRDGDSANDLDRLQLLQSCDLDNLGRNFYLINNNKRLLRFFLNRMPLVFLTTVVYKKEKIKKLFNENFKIGEDLLFYITSVLENKIKFGFINEVGTIKIERKDSMARWQELHKLQYYSNQLDTYLYVKDKFRDAFNYGDNLIVNFQIASHMNMIATCYRDEGNLDKAIKFYYKSAKSWPITYFLGKFKLAAKLVIYLVLNQLKR